MNHLKQYSKGHFLDHKFPYKWYLKDGYPAQGIKHHGLKVFGTFICGGGSSMGYKLAGFDHTGGVEIDKQVADVYKVNHKPKHLYNMDIRDFNRLENLPDELFDLDILDGSPPCSTFSMAGSREKAWGKKKKFREGQSEQTLDDLVFVYLETIKRLRPKVALLENVKGLMQGNAKGYLKEIYNRFIDIGYRVQVFLLDASKMGVPQRRQRVFIIGLRNYFDLPKLKLEFNEKSIMASSLSNRLKNRKLITSSNERHAMNGRTPIHDSNKNTPYTITATGNSVDFCDGIVLGKSFINPEKYNGSELCNIGSYPLDYNFKSLKPGYLIGMSVPPVMTAQIANQIYEQWLGKINKEQVK